MSKCNVSYCPVTGKQMFDRRTQAEKVAYRTKNRLHCTKQGAFYLCEHCGKYHVTHYTHEQSKDFRTRHGKRYFYLFEY